MHGRPVIDCGYLGRLVMDDWCLSGESNLLSRAAFILAIRPIKQRYSSGTSKYVRWVKKVLSAIGNFRHSVHCECDRVA